MMLWMAVALAGGQVNHTWHSLAAKDVLPDGELADLVRREDLQPMLVHGSMFPDNGYGMNRHDYAEPTHWEQISDPYLDWIRQTYEPPWSDEASQHIAFLLGLASHSMADTMFDAVFLERSRVFDAEGWATGTPDLSTDVFFAAAVGSQTLPSPWLPTEAMISIYADIGVTVDAQTLSEGQTRLAIAYGFVAAGGLDAEATQGHADEFPWAAQFIHDPEMPGNPRNVAPIVAAYWQSVWDRLHDRFSADGLVLATVPADGSWEHTRDAQSPESWVYVALARHVDASSLEQVRVEDGDGQPVSVGVSLYYRQGNAIVIKPDESWDEDAVYTVVLDQGLLAADGTSLEAPVRFSFSTAAEPVVVPPEPPADTEPTGCSTGGAAGLGWLGLLVLLGRRRGP